MLKMLDVDVDADVYHVSHVSTAAGWNVDTVNPKLLSTRYICRKNHEHNAAVQDLGPCGGFLSLWIWRLSLHIVLQSGYEVLGDVAMYKAPGYARYILQGAAPISISHIRHLFHTAASSVYLLRRADPSHLKARTQYTSRRLYK